MTCVVCGAAATRIRVVSYEGQVFPILKCCSCSLEFVSPMPSKDVLDRFYSNYQDVRANEDVLLENAKRNIKRMAQYGVNLDSALLDYGSGKDCFIKAARSDKWVSYDPYTKNCNRNVLLDASYDCVTSWGVLEHVTNPNALVSEFSCLLRPGGLLFVTTVDVNRKIPLQYKPPEHLTYWTEGAVEHLLQCYDMELVAYEDYFMVQDRDVYMNTIMRTVPSEYKVLVDYSKLPEFVVVPTNEIFIVARKKYKGRQVVA